MGHGLAAWAVNGTCGPYHFLLLCGWRSFGLQPLMLEKLKDRIAQLSTQADPVLHALQLDVELIAVFSMRIIMAQVLLALALALHARIGQHNAVCGMVSAT